ncbi:hypothetical protein NG799_28500 [Laspinema sp. D1]|uniref:Transmembrane protein n=1 Tax=Laspinema palackyanum D2a TaxID=2953684 RepID=A0ABT2N0I1_9CYAN|nr:hypothetical protein [Laspinema sp. D2a]
MTVANPGFDTNYLDELTDDSDETADSNSRVPQLAQIKSSLFNLFLNRYLAAGLAAAFATLMLSVIAIVHSDGMMSQSATTVAQVDPANCNATEVACLEAIRSSSQNQLQNKRIGEVAKITQFDLNPNNPEAMGYLQMAITNEAIAFNTRVQESRGDRDNPNYGKHPAAIKYASAIEAMKKVNLGAGGEGSTLVWNDPAAVKTNETGKPVLDENGKPQRRVVYEKLSPHLTQAVGMVQLLVNIMSENPNLPQSDAVAVALDLMNGQEDLKTALVPLLRLQGLDAVATELERRDVYGRSVVKNIPEDAAPGQVNPVDYYNPFPGGF